MLTESFLDCCFFISLCDDIEVKRDPTINRNILDILKFHMSIYKDDIPIQIKDKFECLQSICEMKADNRSISTIIDSILSGKYKPLKDFIDEKVSENLDISIIQDYIKQIRNRKKMTILFKDFMKIKALVESIEESKYDTMDTLLDKYNYIIKSLYVNMMEEQRYEAIETSSSLDLMNDDYTYVIDKIKESNSIENCVPSGYELIDNSILRGGFKKTRLYLIGGSSGSGKSTFLVNILANRCNTPMLTTKEKDSDIYVYITLENLVDETFLRLYCCLNDRSEGDAFSDMEAGIDIRKIVQTKLEKSGVNICLFYFPANSITVENVRVVLDDVCSKYGKKRIKAVLVDYLDLFNCRSNIDLYRMQLADITLDLKVLAIDYSIPVISVTQVNKSGYDVGSVPQLTSIGESMKKVDHSDFVAFLTPDGDGKLLFTVRKHRNGPNNKQIVFDVDLSKYKLYCTGSKASNLVLDNIDSQSLPISSFDDSVLLY